MMKAAKWFFNKAYEQPESSAEAAARAMNKEIDEWHSARNKGLLTDTVAESAEVPTYSLPRARYLGTQPPSAYATRLAGVLDADMSSEAIQTHSQLIESTTAGVGQVGDGTMSQGPFDPGGL